jgi:hypothetical protein
MHDHRGGKVGLSQPGSQAILPFPTSFFGKQQVLHSVIHLAAGFANEKPEHPKFATAEILQLQSDFAKHISALPVP